MGIDFPDLAYECDNCCAIVDSEPRVLCEDCSKCGHEELLVSIATDCFINCILAAADAEHLQRAVIIAQVQAADYKAIAEGIIERRQQRRIARSCDSFLVVILAVAELYELKYVS